MKNKLVFILGFAILLLGINFISAYSVYGINQNINLNEDEMAIVQIGAVGYNVSLNFMGSQDYAGGVNFIRLNINGATSSDMFANGNSWNFAPGYSVKVLGISLQPYAGGTNSVKLIFQSSSDSNSTQSSTQSSCYGQICKLYLSESINLAGQSVSIYYIADNQVILSINGINSPLLAVNGYWAEDNSGIRITPTDIINQNYAGGVKVVKFIYSVTNATIWGSNATISYTEPTEISSCNYAGCLNASSGSISCYDSDNYAGSNNVKGITKGASSDGSTWNKVDQCVDSVTLQEFYCDGNKGASELIICPNGCNDGACVLGEGKVVSINDTINSLNETTSSISTTETQTVKCNGCNLDEKCYSFGYRKSGQFCLDDGKFTAQLEADKTCENNFECQSNVCAGGKCISEGFIQSIINWFKRLFGAS